MVETQIIKKLNHYDLSSEHMREIIRDIRNPKYDGFVVRSNKLFYAPLGLEVFDPERKAQALQELYHNPISLGKGQQTFYHLVLSKYLGITRKECIEFLTRQSDYQLTRESKRVYQKQMTANRPFAVIAIDLIDLNQYVRIRDNKGYRYVMTCIDLFTSYCWYFPIKKKEAKDVAKAFENLLAETRGDNIGIVLSDNGTEFQGELRTLLDQNNIKKLTTRSYSPEPHVERANKTFRAIMRQVFVRYNTLAWVPHLDEIQAAKNSIYIDKLKGSPVDIMTAYENNNHYKINTIRNNKLLELRERNKKYNNALVEIGHFVCVKLSAINSKVRKLMKEGNSKLLVVKYSAEVFIIYRLVKTANDKIGLPRYVLEDENGNVLVNENNKQQQFKQSDLLKVSQNTITNLTSNDVNKLNRINAVIQRPELLVPEPVVQPVVRERVEKPIARYTSKDWNTFLKGKDFTDTGVRYRILDIFFERGNNVNNYVVDVIETTNIDANGRPTVSKRNRPKYLLYAVLDEARNEDWFKNDYVNAIRLLMARDE